MLLIHLNNGSSTWSRPYRCQRGLHGVKLEKQQWRGEQGQQLPTFHYRLALEITDFLPWTISGSRLWKYGSLALLVLAHWVANLLETYSKRRSCAARSLLSKSEVLSWFWKTRSMTLFMVACILTKNWPAPATLPTESGCPLMSKPNLNGPVLLESEA
jgi:hypothetical protein